MNKLSYIILSFCCALTLMLGWVVYGQSKEIEKLNKKYVTDDVDILATIENINELDERLKKVEEDNYWKEPVPAFILQFVNDSFMIGFNDHAKRMAGAKKHFLDEEAYSEYLNILKKWGVPDNLLMNQEIMTTSISQTPIRCGGIFTEIFLPYNPDIICQLPLKITFQSGGQRHAIDKTILLGGFEGGELYKIKHIFSYDTDKIDGPLDYFEALKLSGKLN